jgi:hypothetical protein
MYFYEKVRKNERNKKKTMKNTTYRKDNFFGLHILNYYLLIMFAALDCFPQTLSSQIYR